MPKVGQMRIGEAFLIFWQLSTAKCQEKYFFSLHFLWKTKLRNNINIYRTYWNNFHNHNLFSKILIIWAFPEAFRSQWHLLLLKLLEWQYLSLNLTCRLLTGESEGYKQKRKNALKTTWLYICRPRSTCIHADMQICRYAETKNPSQPSSLAIWLHQEIYNICVALPIPSYLV